MPLLNPDNVWFIVAFIAACFVLGCLRTIGFEYYNAVLRHNFKAEVHSLRIKQKRQLHEIRLAGESPELVEEVPQSPSADVEVLSPQYVQEADCDAA